MWFLTRCKGQCRHMRCLRLCNESQKQIVNMKRVKLNPHLIYQMRILYVTYNHYILCKQEKLW